MLNCDYSNNTEYTFNKEICDICDNINYVGVFPENNLENALQCNPISDKWVQLFVPKIVDVPSQKPDMEGIVSVNSCVEIISQRVVKTPEVTGYTNGSGVFIPGEDIPNAECTKLTGKKLIIEGIIKQTVIYTALVLNQALHSASFTIPFSVFIILEKDTALNREYQLYPYLEHVFECMLSERSIFSNATIFIKAIPVC